MRLSPFFCNTVNTTSEEKSILLFLIEEEIFEVIRIRHPTFKKSWDFGVSTSCDIYLKCASFFPQGEGEERISLSFENFAGMREGSAD